MLTVLEAEVLITRHVQLYPPETIDLVDAAGRFLLEPIAADRDLPPFDRATMDGIAIAFAAWEAGVRRFRAAGTQAAGQPGARLDRAETSCLEIMTGAVLPDGADTVVPYEHLTVQDGQATVVSDAGVVRGQNIHRRGTDRRIGELLLPAGTRLNSPQIAIAASAGRSQVKVSRPPAIGVVSVGDELVDLDQTAALFQIRPSNAYGMRAALTGLGCDRIELARIPDKPDVIERVLDDLLQRCGMLLLSGGVSKGLYDFVPRTLAKLGVREVFHRVRQKPGQPMWFGMGPRDQPVFALPGNPVSTLVCLHRYVLPYVVRCCGAEPAPASIAALDTEVRLDRPFTHFLPVRVEPQVNLPCRARLQTYHGSGDYASLGESHGFVELPPEREVYPAGALVRYHAWSV